MLQSAAKSYNFDVTRLSRQEDCAVDFCINLWFRVQYLERLIEVLDKNCMRLVDSFLHLIHEALPNTKRFTLRLVHQVYYVKNLPNLNLRFLVGDE